jgi:hypothetical protein
MDDVYTSAVALSIDGGDGGGSERYTGTISPSTSKWGPHARHPKEYDDKDSENDLLPTKHDSEDDDDAEEVVSSLLLRIVKEDCSYFSLKTMHEKRELLEKPLSGSHLFVDGDDDDNKLEPFAEQGQSGRLTPRRRKLIAHEQIASWFGSLERIAGEYESFVDRLESVESFTPMEFASWIGRHRVVGTLLLGGVNPCLRGRLCATKPSSSSSSRQRNDVHSNYDDDAAGALRRLQELGTTLVLPRLFDRVPLSLSTYVVKRVVEMRQCGMTILTSEKDDKDSGSLPCTTCFPCSLCRNRRVPTTIRLVFNVGSCRHAFCEPCFWRNLVQDLDNRLGDVVVCPVCGDNDDGSEAAADRNADDESRRRSVPALASSSDLLSPLERRQQSLQKFQALPANGAELKSRATTKRKRKVRPPLASTWSEAVQSCLGSTQEVRRDRFWLNLERRSFHYVRGCLDMGVNVLETNQYGQTPLYLAAYSGDERLVQLLLRYYTPQDVRTTSAACSNGGVSIIGAARASQHYGVVRVLLEYGVTETGSDGDSDNVQLDNLSPSRLCEVRDRGNYSPRLTVLIDPSVHHPGAGSYLIDECLCPRAVETLKNLWNALPPDTASKKKEVQCSTRRYFCDAEKRVASALLPALAPFFDVEDCFIFPHMRYLLYSEPGTLLKPHVDLQRTDPITNDRSTHTLILYLTDCVVGGATTLLEDMSGQDKPLARVQPRRARLLLFPHGCPHEGEVVVDVPKLLIRGEARLPWRLNGAQGVE